MADLLADILQFLLWAILGLFVVYLTIRVGTMAALKSLEDYRRNRKQVLNEGE